MFGKLQHLRNLRQIFQKSVESVLPTNLLSETNNYYLTPRQKDGHSTIQIQSKIIDITGKRCHVVGFGKAVLGLAVKLEKSLEDNLISGIISIPAGTLNQFKDHPSMQLRSLSKIQVFEGAPNNQPDEVALQAAKCIKALASTMTQNDILFVFVTGGGSALLPLPRPPLLLEEKMQLIRSLANRGAAIDEINIVRIALSDIKGGRLSAAAKNAFAVVSFVISDIVGDPIDLIASGPTVSQIKRSTPQEVLVKYDLWKTLPQHIQELMELMPEKEETTPSRNNAIYVVGDNRVATAKAMQEALECEYNPFIASTTIQGESINEETLRQSFPFDCRIFQHFVKTLQICEANKKPMLLIFAGEPTIKVTGRGLGGRNQELALRMSLEFFTEPEFSEISFLSAGTDGIDGPTLAAGALGSSLVIEEFLQKNSNNTLETVKEFLNSNNSYEFYKQLSGGQFHVITGHTGTNVMDLHLMLVP